ncbi:MerR family transcriptional regulator [Aerococcaceae bacterium zg-B36]|uniref:MerR family transcriptional regulator n=1 Tax=Aerococcaceae bacterium zg-252 TaxID=2796928 RepID=UPI001BD8844F|nr:MerR family transcriptional regulator [Aerococcaceae bacterium zg-B36]
MAHKELKKSLAIFPIGTVMRLTGLTARQIRYYEDYHLISPERTETNRRLYSLNDIDRLLEIMDMIDDGMTLKGIQKHYHKITNNDSSTTNQLLTDQDVRRILQDELDIRMRF